MWELVASALVGSVIGYHAATSSRAAIEDVRASGPVFGEAHIAERPSTMLLTVLLCTAVAMYSTSTLGIESLLVSGWCLWWSVRIGIIDVDTHVITTTSVKRAAIGTGALIVVSTALDESAFMNSSLAKVVLGAIVCVSVMKILQYASRGDLGGGDVTVSLWLGMFAGWRSLDTVVISILWAFLCAGVVSTVLIALRRTTLRTHLAFGPFLILGTWIGVLR